MTAFLVQSAVQASCVTAGGTMGVKIFVSLDTPDSKVSNTLGKQDNKLSYD